MLPTIVVDNFFENVNEVIKLSKKIKYSPPRKEEYWVGLRTESLHINHYKLFNSIISKVLDSYFPYKNPQYENSAICFHKLLPGCKKSNDKTRYHQDSNVKLAGIIYLSCGDRKSGTTLFNKQKKKQIVISNDFNTLVCYDGSKLHGPTILKVNKERLTMNIFIKKIKVPV
tara:strand:+ start:380 stop:892 length:513 start_codon:yes stop_codon:yes gene_type:complete